MKRFNITGTCTPSKHYMVDISGKLEQIMKLIADGCYFTINRARQYGKTTTLSMIQRHIPPEYVCVRMSFQGVDEKSFETNKAFCKMFIQHAVRSLRHLGTSPKEYIESWDNSSINDLNDLSEHITNMCKDKKVVLLIDEFDKVGNYHMFLNFLSILREKFLLRIEDMDYTFHSVILAGVYDIGALKQKMIDDGLYIPSVAENKTQGSPWNITVNFTVDMSFSPSEIITMLEEYEAVHKTGMNMAAISEEIHNLTGGYPFLVSMICRHIDEEQGKNWTLSGIQKAVQPVLSEITTLFEDVFKNLKNDTELHDYIYNLLIKGTNQPFVIHDPIVATGVRYGYFKNSSGKVVISNKIFELAMTEYFISKDLRNKKQVTGVLHTDVIKNGIFDMELCLRKFANHYIEIFNDSDVAFLERHGRLLFLSYLKPLINGHGFYHIESQLTDLRRMDIVVDFGPQQFIIELKLWRGEQYQAEAYTQLCGYLESKNADTGYMLTFDFRGEGSKVRKAEWVEVEGKRILDVRV